MWVVGRDWTARDAIDSRKLISSHSCNETALQKGDNSVLGPDYSFAENNELMTTVLVLVDTENNEKQSIIIKKYSEVYSRQFQLQETRKVSSLSVIVFSNAEKLFMIRYFF